MFAVSWQEQSGATVTDVQDYDRGLVHSSATPPDGRFQRMTGTCAITRPASRAFDHGPHRNKALVIDTMTSLLQRHNASAVDRLHVADYLQHNPGIPQGRDALRTLVEGLLPDMRYGPGLVIAEGAYVAIYGRIHGWSEKPQVVVDLFRIENGRLAEHWDVLQDEVPADFGMGGLSMLDPEECARQAGRR